MTRACMDCMTCCSLAFFSSKLIIARAAFSSALYTCETQTPRDKPNRQWGRREEEREREKTHLVLFSDTNGVHAGVPISTHDVSQVLIRSNLICNQTNLTSPWDSLPALNIGSHGIALARKEVLSVGPRSRFRRHLFRSRWANELRLFLQTGLFRDLSLSCFLQLKREKRVSGLGMWSGARF